MPRYRFRVRLLPNPMLEFNPDESVWRDIAIHGSATLADFHEVIYDAFDRVEPHLYEFITHDEAGIATRSYVPPTAYEGKPSWPEMDDDEIDRFITRAVPDEVSEDAKARFRELRRDPPTEADAAETTIDSLDPESLQSLFYEFDLGDGWEHHIELEGVREDPPDREPEVVAAQGESPPQYPDLADLDE